MQEVRRCWAWVEGWLDAPERIGVLENGDYLVLGGIVANEQVTEIPPAEWLRANETDFRELLEACHTLVDRQPTDGQWAEARSIIREIVDRRWEPKA